MYREVVKGAVDGGKDSDVVVAIVEQIQEPEAVQQSVCEETFG